VVSQPRVELEVVDLSSALGEAVDALRLAHPQHAMTVTAPPHLLALTDTLRLRQIIDNLVTNACKFSPVGSAVELGLTARDQEVLLTVRDRGRGIPAEHLSRVFERFERVEDPLVMTTSGAGLGLYIVRQLVEALGGTIMLRSEVGTGTIAEVRLPLLDTGLGRPAAPAMLTAPAAAQLPARVLAGQREGSSSSSRVSSSDTSSSS
jgi:signal transduction histidine kinase